MSSPPPGGLGAPGTIIVPLDDTKQNGCLKILIRFLWGRKAKRGVGSMGAGKGGSRPHPGNLGR